MGNYISIKSLNKNENCKNILNDTKCIDHKSID